MNIKIHRGLEQIGGCITEIFTDTSRIFIDFGQNLPGCGKPSTPEEDENLVKTILSYNNKKHEAIFYSHGHEDHVGLFEYIPNTIPQYMSTGAKELLSIKYGLLSEGASLNVDELQKNNCSSEEYSTAVNLYTQAENKCKLIKQMRSWYRTAPQKKPESIMIGDIKVTPFFNCHSIYDSHMFLIEADDKRIWHTGDYREHGYMGKGLIPTLKKYATNIDTLITEGTMLNRDDKCIHEREVSAKMTNMMCTFKYVFVLASATDIERLAAIKEAANKSDKAIYVCSKFMKQTMAFFTEQEKELSRGLFSFHPKFYSQRLVRSIKRNGMVMITGSSQKNHIKEIIKELPQEETLLIYSLWDGYYKNLEQIKENPVYKEFREMFYNVVDIHTSGHADRKTIEKVIRTINPKKIICIHKEADAEL